MVIWRPGSRWHCPGLLIITMNLKTIEMKRKIILCFLLSMALSNAVADDITLGYCDGNNVSEHISGTDAVAIRLPSEAFNMYQGSSIIGVRIGLGSVSERGVKIFVKDKLDGSDLYAFNSGPLYEGWSDVLFDTPLEFSTSDIVVGYETPSGVRPGVSAIQGYTSSDGCLVKKDSMWIDKTAEGSSPLCIQLIVSGDSYTKNDAALLSADNMTIGRKSPFSITGNLRNNTASVLNAARFSLTVDGKRIEGDAAVAEVLPGEIGEFTFLVDGLDNIGTYTGRLEIVSVGGNPDEYAFNSTSEISLHVVDELVTRKVLLEEFTGQGCGNCPAGQTRIKEAVKGLDNVIMVAHHWGFGKDLYTATGSSAFNFFYNETSTYTPAHMIDRQPSPGNPGPVEFTGSASDIRYKIVQRQKRPAEVAVSIKRNYDSDTRLLKVQAAMKQVSGMEIGDNPVVNVFLIENGIIGQQNPGYKEYEHNEVNRLFVTEPLGDPVSLSENDSTYATYQVEINKEWNADNMEIVAFVSNHNPDDCNDCDVYNAEICPLVGNDDIEDSGIGGIAQEKATVSAIYSISGIRLQKLRPGVNIVRYSDGSVRKIVVRNNG